jgi:magnesium-transporting ATPase (P-type)
MIPSHPPQTWTGLSTADVSTRLKTEGYNELPNSQQRSLGQLIWDIFQEPIFLLLAGCGAIKFYKSKDLFLPLISDIHPEKIPVGLFCRYENFCG